MRNRGSGRMRGRRWGSAQCRGGRVSGKRKLCPTGHLRGVRATCSTFVANTATAIHPLGQEVLYNGIARSPGRDDFRSIGLLNYADLASNEGSLSFHDCPVVGQGP